MRLLVCGSRNWCDIDTIGLHMPDDGENVTVIHGGAKGADTLAGIVAHGLGFDVEVFEADWKRHGRSAGMIRNGRMLTEGRPDRGIAFGALWHRSACANLELLVGAALWKPAGTGNMVTRMLEARVPVRWVAATGSDAVDLVEMPAVPRLPTAQEVL